MYQSTVPYLVAEVGFEPHDLRVMSPTSYQAALLRDIWSSFSLARVIIPHFRSLVKSFFAFLVKKSHFSRLIYYTPFFAQIFSLNSKIPHIVRDLWCR